MKLTEIFRSKKGESFPLTIAIVLVLIMIICGISEYFRLMIIAQGVRDSLQDAVITTTTQNYANVYHGTREGYSGGYLPSAKEFSEAVDYGNIYEKLAEVLGMDYTGKYEKITSKGDQQFELYDLQVDVKNAPFAKEHDAQNRFEIDSYITLEVPVSFAGELLPPMKIRIKTSSGYTAIF